jgi:hypothetical protein
VTPLSDLLATLGTMTADPDATPAPGRCPVEGCHDGRIIRRRDDGSTWVAPCTCSLAATVERRCREGRCGYPRYETPPRVSDYLPGRASEHPDAARLGRRWVETWEPGRGALVYGVTGAGKTRFAVALANAVSLRRRLVVRLVSCLSHIPSSWHGAEAWREDIRPAALAAELLIIDNLRADFEPFRLAEVAQLAEEAVRNRQSVIVTTTLAPGQLVGCGSWGDVCSRVGEFAGSWRFDLGSTDCRVMP